MSPLARTVGSASRPVETHTRNHFGTSLSNFSTFPRNRSALLQSGQPTNLVLPDYAHNADKMHTTSQDDDRPTNRFYRFLTSSRSRSRSTQSSSHDVQPHSSELTHNSTPQSHSRESTWSSRTSDRGRSSNRSSGKPFTILPSRPLSSTTTATNTTVTPSTPKGKQRMAQPSSTTSSSSHAEALQENSNLLSTPADPTPKTRASTRRKLRNIFGIHSRKSSVSSSRATSASPSRNPSIQPGQVPPVPLHPDTFTSHDLSKSTRTQSPDPVSFSRAQSPSPIPQSHTYPLASSVSTTASSASKIDHLTKFLSPGPRSKNPRRSSTSLSTPPSSSDSILPIVSGPTKPKRASTSVSDANTLSHGRSTPGHSQPRNTSSSSKATTTSESSGINGMAPRIPQTSNLSRSATASTRMSHRKDSMDSTHRYRPLVIVDEENERESPIESPKGKAKELDPGSSRVGKRRGSESSDSRIAGRSRNGGHGHQSKQINIRATKHGSFDFEKPTWATGGLLMRSLSGSGGQSRRNANGNNEGWENGNSRTKDGESHRRRNGNVLASDSTRPKTPQRTPPSKTVTLQTDDTPTPSKGHSSSLGKSAGKRALGVGMTRLVSIAHGPFSFEPAVPSPTFNPKGTNTPPNGINSESEPGRKNKKDKRQGEKGTAIKEEALSRSTSIRSKVTEPDSILTSSTSGGYSRSSGRGRSLDLGLGLSWAPTKVREDVLLPAGTFAARSSHSASSRKTVNRHVGFEETERTKVGQEIAEVFKEVLDEDAFIAFKHYVHQFDAHEIPFDGPSGIVARTERLLNKASALELEDQRNLMNKLIRVILHNV